MFGPHVNRYHAREGSNMVEHIEEAINEARINSNFNIDVVGLFVSNPNSRNITLTVEERKLLKVYLSDRKLVAIAHSTYCSTPWKGDTKTIDFIHEELRVCQEAGIAGLVIHLPRLPISHIMSHIHNLYIPEITNVRIYLEIPAVNPENSYYETPKKLASLFSEIRKHVDPDLDYFGLCIDTAHLWVCGINLQSYALASQWINAMEKYSNIIHPRAIMMHLNDSASSMGIEPDRHASLTLGKMWGGCDDITTCGLLAFTDYIQRYNMYAILERKPKEILKNDYTVLRKILQ